MVDYILYRSRVYYKFWLIVVNFDSKFAFLSNWLGIYYISIFSKLNLIQLFKIKITNNGLKIIVIKFILLTNSNIKQQDLA